MLVAQRSFIRFLYDLINYNELTPYIMVDAEYPDVQVPQEFVENSTIILNIAPCAVQSFNLNAHQLTFKADFDSSVGIVGVVIPINSILSLYAKENSLGVFFKFEEEDPFKPFVGKEQNLSKKLPEFTVVE